MFCPEDGTEVTMTHSDAVFAFYPPCSECGTEWLYNGERGCYEVKPGTTLAPEGEDPWAGETAEG